MSVLVPLNSLEYLPRYLEAGADQFYCGFYDADWSGRFGRYADLNRMSGFGRAANAYDFEELLYIVGKVKEAGKRVYIPFNAASYTAEQVAYQRFFFERLAYYGADGVIVSLPEQVALACSCGIDAVISTMGGCYNSLTVEYYAALGARRVILPRDLSLGQIEAIVQHVPGVEYEVFLMRNGCVFSDSHCLGMHGMGRGALCAHLKAADKSLYATGLTDLSDFEATDEPYCASFHRYTCGLCALWRLSQLGIEAYKIVGRSDDPDSLCCDIGLAQRNLAIAQSCSSQEEYLRRMEQHPFRDIVCRDRLNCYYPEVAL